MTRFVFRVLLVAVLGLGAAGLAAAPAGAAFGPPGECGLIGSDGGNYLGVGNTYLAPNGNTVVVCRATGGVLNTTGRTQVYTAWRNPIGSGVGINCAGIITTDWWEVLTPGGGAVLACFGHAV